VTGLIVSLVAAVGGGAVTTIVMFLAVSRIIRMSEALEASTRETMTERDGRREAERQRDEAVRQRAVSDDAAATSDRLMRAAQASAFEARKVFRDDIKVRLANAGEPDAVRIVDELLGAPLSGSPGARSDSDGAAAPAGPVSTAGPTGADPARR